MDYIERLVAELSDAESIEDVNIRRRLHKPIGPALSPLPPSPPSDEEPTENQVDNYESRIENSQGFFVPILLCSFQSQFANSGPQPRMASFYCS